MADVLTEDVLYTPRRRTPTADTAVRLASAITAQKGNDMTPGHWIAIGAV